MSFITTLDLIAQIGIALFGVTALVLVARKNKWGFVLGLISQPFFFITVIINKQWGIFTLAFIYTFTWAYGIYEWFYKDAKK
ncbi:nicotinamide mononucleotide transporter [Candidatus Woesearchaeota archaeon]|nr:nicotinamide mononucleotide transporter [Candidatus Woesearchaeota archaeon]